MKRSVAAAAMTTAVLMAASGIGLAQARTTKFNVTLREGRALLGAGGGDALGGRPPASPTWRATSRST